MISQQLIHRKSGRVLFEWVDEKPIFHDVFLGKVLNELGIFVPPFLREEFEGKPFIKTQDPLFLKAFCEIYIPSEFDEEHFLWTGENILI